MHFENIYGIIIAEILRETRIFANDELRSKSKTPFFWDKTQHKKHFSMTLNMKMMKFTKLNEH